MCGERERERERETQTDRQTDRQTETETERQRETERARERCSNFDIKAMWIFFISLVGGIAFELLYSFDRSRFEVFSGSPFKLAKRKRKN